MRRLAVFAVFVSIAAVAAAQTTTPNVQLTLPAYGTQNWNLQINPNFQKIDQAIGLLQLPYAGAWSSTTLYQRGQQVSYNSAFYTSVINSNYNNTPSDTSLVWQKVPYASGGGGSLPSGPAYSVQLANSLVTGPTSDSGFTYDVTKHALNVGGTLDCTVVQCFTMTPHAPLAAAWTLDTYSPDTALASINGVKNTTTVNGHVLSGNIALAYSDLGNLPVSSLNSGTGATSSTWWRGDGTWVAPVASINGIGGPVSFNGPGVTCSGNPLICVFNGGTSTTINSQSGALAFNGDGLSVSGSTFSIPWQRGIDAYATLHLDKSGATDVSATVQSFYNTYTLGTIAPDLHFPCGVYYWHSGLNTNAANVHMIGDGKVSNISAGTQSGGQMSSSCVTFTSDQPIVFLWFNTTISSSNLNSAEVEHIQFTDTSASHNQVVAAIRITNQANFRLADVGGINLDGQDITGLTVAVNAGSTSWTVSGATISCSSVVGGFVWVNGLPHEITACSGTGPYTITSALQFEGANYSGSGDISFGGKLLWLDPGSAASGFAQFGDIYDLKGHCVANAIFAGSGANGSLGTSRVKFTGGYVNGCSGSVPDTIGAYLGHYSDTFKTGIKMNSYAFSVFIADGHQHDISGLDWENASGSTPVVPSCGSSPSYACAYGVYVMSDNASDTYGNRITNNYLRQAGSSQGVGITLNGIAGQYPTQTKIWGNTFRSLGTNCSISNSTHSTGECDGVGYFDSLNVNGVPVSGGSGGATPVSLSIVGFPAAANTCYYLVGSTWTAVTSGSQFNATSMTGLTSTMTPWWSYQGNPFQTNGWGAFGGMSPKLWADQSTPGQLDWIVCNVTGNSITTNTTLLRAGAQ